MTLIGIIIISLMLSFVAGVCLGTILEQREQAPEKERLYGQIETLKSNNQCPCESCLRGALEADPIPYP